MSNFLKSKEAMIKLVEDRISKCFVASRTKRQAALPTTAHQSNQALSF